MPTSVSRLGLKDRGPVFSLGSKYHVAKRLANSLSPGVARAMSLQGSQAYDLWHQLHMFLGPADPFDPCAGYVEFQLAGSTAP